MNKVKSGMFFFVFFAAVIAVIVIFFIPSVMNLCGYFFYDSVDSIDSKEMKQGNYVCVEYDCVLNGYNTIHDMFSSVSDYILKFGDDEQFVYVRVPSDAIKYWDGCNLFLKPQEAAGFTSSEKHRFIGKVEQIDKDLRKQYVDRMNSKAYPEYIMINTEENTNLDFYIKEIVPWSELIGIVIEIIVLFIGVKFALRHLSKLIDAIKEKETADISD